MFGDALFKRSGKICACLKGRTRHSTRCLVFSED
ncbi:hypothetical protein MPTK1_2g13320 [Marchantia polymorpha subsp. ruderalis]|uniref:Uncharacterized protein n=1 Tax=Marchantia polymorpha TaxID=3197 RepID=A0A2R6XAM2_MARPO|nr:hypothetical protein MARPO_0026s0040 [Marchantia polymorpha]BBN02162.1 hypothetical protein Mp_2g13320 [Marchantia polymorpha subsp. ruderalis]|eukprot:PTQ43157.1 hypothetical protein MARPO_0026s0040 [Marchantia polymorpha]